ncbi:MAG: permease [Chloroflexota bacterium]
MDATQKLRRPYVIAIALGALVILLLSLVPLSIFAALGQRLPVFATVFLGIFIEAVPYLLLGTLASGLVEVFVDRQWMMRVMPRGNISAALAGAMLGLAFPVCECGVIPLTRRLFQKGLPTSAGVAFLLAAPVFNPIVIFSTAAAFGWGAMLFWRLGLTLGIAVLIGIVFSVEKDAVNVIKPILPVIHTHSHGETVTFREKVARAFVIGADEFFEMGRYLVIGAMLAAAMQTFIGQGALLSIGQGPVFSVLVMLALAFILSICSTVDAFVALGFVGTFSFGAILSFLTFGPMVDIKSLLMYRQVFQKRAVGYLVLLPFLISLLTGLALNYFSP